MLTTLGILIALAVLLFVLFPKTADPHGINIVTCGFTPTGGSNVPIKGIRSLTLSLNPTELTEGADNDFFDTVCGLTGLAPKVAIEGNRVAILHAVTPGVYGALVYTVPSFQNGIAASGGGYTVTGSNGYYVPGDETHAHRALATIGPHFSFASTDGITSPIVYTAL